MLPLGPAVKMPTGVWDECRLSGSQREILSPLPLLGPQPWDTGGQHENILSSVKVPSQMRWVGTGLECGSLVTRVPSSFGLYRQEVRSLLSLAQCIEITAWVNYPKLFLRQEQ